MAGRASLRALRSRSRDLRALRRDAHRTPELDDAGCDGRWASCYAAALSPSEMVIAAETVRRLEAGSSSTRCPHDREMIALSCIARRPRAEFAAVMGRSEDAVFTLLSRALDASAHALAPARS